MQFTKTKTAIVVVASIIVVLVSLPVQQRTASGVPLPQAEQQRIHNLAALCTEAVSENWYYGNFTTVTDESILSQCDDIFVDLKNQCDSIALVMEQCSDPAYDKYIVDRGLSSRIEPEQSDPMQFSSPSSSSPANVEENEDNHESTDEDENNDEDEDN